MKVEIANPIYEFIRAAARINYATEGIKRYNYNEAKRVDIR